MITTFPGRHYETGTIANALAAMGAVSPKTGRPYSEALALGASGGIAFGYFVFEYTGHLPHVALLTRNTFSPFERALDNLAIRRDSRETTQAKRAEDNLRLELDAGNVVIVWADVFSMPYRGLCATQMWHMQPLLVVGQDGSDFLVADGASVPLRVSAEELDRARGKVKKDRYRMTILEAPDTERLGEGLIRGMETCAALFLDKPPMGSANNFGFTGMRNWAKMLTDPKNPKGWARTFAPGPRLTQALAGKIGQPGVWDWISTWGTAPAGDRGRFAAFLREAAVWTGLSALNSVADAFDLSAIQWEALAEASMPDLVPEFARLKELKRRRTEVWISQPPDAVAQRAAMANEMRSLIATLGEPGRLEPFASEIQAAMAEIVLRIAEIEEPAVREMRAALG
ncbi:BtrH N-terminal domain-containing protein [Fimbriimonas ginsengisoli]|uniref:Butirosin biosynthesis protein H N-terminal domain-containing protein n=1 Tax=Fimbriimonas ginsengisoli Gsoil 348 TaxID=661478 RepID=A0A068NPW3_FIMGI|nr:BtrH N-terminal domain-containing protein [Fimbriimonas ginsengisoli]AIE85568.1 hypothetical protein OP10G_2200 [Fimbriimonas ginsengisoli Gsoil 348]